MLKKIHLSLVFLTFSFLSLATWTDLNTGINDNLTGVVMWGNNGAVTGNQGVYYTTTGGSGPASWTRFNITGNVADSILYNNTNFSHCFAYSTHTNLVMVCGEDTVNNQAVIMQFNLPAMTYTIRYVGVAGSSLNGIGYSDYSSNYFAVGNNGLIIKFKSSTNGAIVSTSLTQDLLNIEFRLNKFTVACSEYRILGTDLTSSLQIDVNDYQSGFFTEDVVYNTATTIYAVGDEFQHINTSTGTPTIYNYYNFGPLNARASTMRGSSLVVVTDHGAFFSSSGSNYSILQWEPSSMKYGIHPHPIRFLHAARMAY